MSKNNRILAIDDESDIRDLYRMILSPTYGYELTFAGSGEEAIEVVKESLKKKNPYAVIFMDMMLGGLSGAEAAAWILQIDPRIKVVFVTAYSRYLPEDYTLVVGKDNFFYLRKPFTTGEILQFARALTDQWILEDEKEKLTKNLTIVNSELEDINQNLQKKVEEQTTMLIQQDKMASIGLLATGIAHEINNPIAFVNSNLMSLKTYSLSLINLIQKYNELVIGIESVTQNESHQLIKEIHDIWDKQKVDFIIDDIEELIDDSLEGTQRVSKIVKDLKGFARVHDEDIESVNLNEVIDGTLNILKNQLKYKIKVIKNYGDLPPIKCFVHKMSQVLMNLITNSAQAIKDKGTIKIATRDVKDNTENNNEYIELSISDDGVGIPKENITKIFDAFFTTKPVGLGTGLGLKIAYDIIKAHNGKIVVESEEGKDTTFTIRLPRTKLKLN